MPIAIRKLRSITLAAVFAAGIAATAAHAAERLPSYNVDIKQTSVSGLSSGAFMSVQFQVAYSSTLAGAGIVAGGPFYCAQGRASYALFKCMKTTIREPDPAELLNFAQKFEKENEIDSLDNLKRQRVYVFGGTRDETVTPPVVASTISFYKLAGVPEANLKTRTDMAAGHAVITQDSGSACARTEPPFINKCDYDQAGSILSHIYGDLNPPAAKPGGKIIPFSQAEFLKNKQPRTHSMDRTGYVYVPAACAEGKPCKVHIAFHGCAQSVEAIGDKFYRNAGYNRWADTNGIIVLYPQAVSMGFANPQGCWDWWGYDSDRYHTRNGPQMAAVKGMLDRLASGSR